MAAEDTSMIHEGTDYELVSTPTEYKACHTFLRENKVRYTRSLMFPTIIATRDNKVIGVIGTKPSRVQIMAGPIFAKVDGNQSFVVKKLIQAYEGVLRLAGVTKFIFAFDIEDYKWLKIVRKFPDVYTELGSDKKSSSILFERSL